MLRVFGWADSINERDEADGGGLGEVNCHEPLGGLLRYYHRDAA